MNCESLETECHQSSGYSLTQRHQRESSSVGDRPCRHRHNIRQSLASTSSLSSLTSCPKAPSFCGIMPSSRLKSSCCSSTTNLCQFKPDRRSHYARLNKSNMSHHHPDDSSTIRRPLAKSAPHLKGQHLAMLVILVLVPTFAQALNPLNQYISHYEPLQYDHKPIVASIHRSRRAASQYVSGHPEANPLIEIGFSAHGRHFPLRVKRDVESSVFHPDLVIEDGNGQPLSVNLDHLVTGHLHGQPNSLVYGSIRDGVFEGKIHSTLPTEQVYFVERAHKYFQPESVLVHLPDRQDRVNRTHSAKFNLTDVVRSVASSQTSTPVITPLTALPFHSLIYNADHVVDPHSSKRSPLDGACGADEKVRQWMDSVSNSAVDDNDDDDTSQKSKKNRNNTDKLEQQIDSFFREHSLHGQQNDRVNAAADSNGTNGKPQQRPIVNRTKRASNVYHNYRIPGFQEAQGRISYRPTPPPETAPRPPKRRACSLYIQTDTFLWNHMKKHEAIKDDFKVREEIASLVAQHIKAVNHIYETSVFKDIIGLKFIVQRLRINDSSACDSVKREHNQFCSPNIDVSNFLNLNSQFNHNDFCLAYIFTYRDFSGGTLGLAWVASTSGASGGICEKYKTYTENIGGRQVQTKRSLNTGIITFVNYNSRVPPKVSELTLAHEIGHNFGSPHDYPGECRPGGPLGNYIMYSSATSGERQNNNKFSHCSVNNISTVLHAVFNNEGKENCFQEDNGAFCGNKIVEDGEDCDCGYDSRECNEDCCYPRNVDEFKDIDPYAQPCKRRPGSYCSPSEGPCCTEKCTFETDMKQCREDGECTYKSFCDGERANCPAPPAKPNKTECNMGTQVCWTGSCSGSICQKYDLEECFLTAKRGSKPDEMCEVACQKRSQPETCRRTSEIAIMKNVSGMKLRPGSPCNDFQGYCDVFQRCRAVDAEGPLARLKNLLFNKKTLISIKQWVMTYWWLCTLIMFGAILFMAAFIKCCAVHTPSSNPKRKKALRLTDTLRRPADTLRRKSRERSNVSSSRQQRSSREHGHSSSNGGHGHHRHSQSHSAAQQQQMPLTNSSSSQPSHHQSSHPSEYHHQTATSLLQSASAPPPPLPQSGTGQFPPTLVVNLPPPAKDSHLPQQPFDPPPPYPGIPKPSVAPLNIVASPVNGGPSHGYGEGRGHYNRHGQSNVPTSAKLPGPGKSNAKHQKGDGESSGKSRRS